MKGPGQPRWRCRVRWREGFEELAKRIVALERNLVVEEGQDLCTVRCDGGGTPALCSMAPCEEIEDVGRVGEVGIQLVVVAPFVVHLLNVVVA